MSKKTKQKVSKSPITDKEEENWATQSDVDAGMTRRMMVPSEVCSTIEERLTVMTEANRKALDGLRLAVGTMGCMCSNVRVCGHESDCDTQKVKVLIKELGDLINEYN